MHPLSFVRSVLCVYGAESVSCGCTRVLLSLPIHFSFLRAWGKVKSCDYARVLVVAAA